MFGNCLFHTVKHLNLKPNRTLLMMKYGTKRNVSKIVFNFIIRIKLANLIQQNFIYKILYLLQSGENQCRYNISGQRENKLQKY